MNDINNGTQKMLNIKQLVSILKECKRRYLASQGNHLFDSGDKIIFTTYLKEYYYDVNPENTSETVENGLWKKFVNTQERVLNILSNLQYSQDQMSTKSIALYSIRQSSIQTHLQPNISPRKSRCFLPLLLHLLFTLPLREHASAVILPV